MKKQSVTYRISALLLTFIMLFSTVGFSIDIHYCGGEIENIGFYEKAKECDMMKKAKMSVNTHSCCPSSKSKVKSHCSKKSSKDTIKKGSCCVNDTFVLQSTDDGQAANEFHLSQVDLTFVAVYIVNEFINLNTTKKTTNFCEYSPPLITQDVTVLHQVFII